MFSKEEIFERILNENPWWNTREIPAFILMMKRRMYFRLLYPLISSINIRRAVVLMGPRRVGKSVLIYHSIQELIDSGVNPLHIIYLSLDVPVYTGLRLDQLLQLSMEVRKVNDLDGTFIFFDEIQYLPGWEQHLKVLVDRYPNIKFVVSGSAAAALKLKSRESGAGRFTDFVLPPLTFHEFMYLRGMDDLMIRRDRRIHGVERPYYESRDINTLNSEFIDYLNFGGYPEISLSKELQQDAGRFIRSDIIDKVLLRDLPSLYGIQDIRELNRLFAHVAYRSGQEFSLEGLANDSGIVKITLNKYLEYLEAAFLIKRLDRIDKSAKQFKRAATFKLYLTNPSMRSALFSPVKAENAEVLGHLVETGILAQWLHRSTSSLYYARFKSGEVDFVSLNQFQKPVWALEIKWSNKAAQDFQDLKAVHQFSLQNKLKTILITTRSVSAQQEKDGINYWFMPASEYAYTLGYNAIEDRYSSHESPSFLAPPR